MPDWFHRTDKHLLPSVSVNSLPEAAANYIENPSLPPGVPHKYLNVVGDVITEMTQPEKDAVDAAEAAALLASNKSISVSNIDETGTPIGWEIRALIQIFNKRDNYLVNRIAELQAALDAVKASSGPADNIRNAIPASWLATNTRALPAARQDYKDEIIAGTVDT